ncbi:MAG: hypothetical protein QM640_16125 [Niabella sp.]
MIEFILAFLMSLIPPHTHSTTTDINSDIYVSTLNAPIDTTDPGGDKGHIPPDLP